MKAKNVLRICLVIGCLILWSVHAQKRSVWLENDYWAAGMQNETGIEGKHLFFSYPPAWIFPKEDDLNGNSLLFSNGKVAVSKQSIRFQDIGEKTNGSDFLLHCFERNPVLSGRFTIGEIVDPSQARFSILARWNGRASYLSFNFDWAAERVSLIEKIEGHHSPRVLAQARFPDFIEPRNLAVFCEQSHVALFADGELLLESSEVRLKSFGQIGFNVNKMMFEVTDLEVAGQNQYPVEGVSKFSIQTPYNGAEQWGNQIAVAETRKGELMGVLSYHQRKGSRARDMQPLFVLRSLDKGESWKQKINLNASKKAELLTTDKGVLRYNWPQLYRLNSGRLLTFGFVDGDLPVFVVSDDDGQSWQIFGGIQFPDGSPDDKQIMPGKIFQDGTGRLHAMFRGFYFTSEDEGKSWDFIRQFPHGLSETQEYNFIEREDRSLDIYYRDGRVGAKALGFMPLSRAISIKDPAEFSKSNSPFISPKVAFNIQGDEYVSGVRYCAWIYNDRKDDLWRNNGPRTRIALAVSKNYGQSWEFLMDVEDWAYPYDKGWEVRDSRYVNLSLHVGKDDLFLTTRRFNADLRVRLSEEDDEASHMQGFESYFIRISKRNLPMPSVFPETRY